MPDPSVQAAGAINNGSLGSCTPGLPSGIVNGSFLVIGVGVLADTTFDPAPAGWTAKIVDDDQNPSIELLYKRSNGTESAPTVTYGATHNGGGQMLRVEDEDTVADPFGATTTATSAAGASQSPAINLTGLPAGALGILVIAGAASRDITTVPTGWTRHSPAGNQRVHILSKQFPSGGDMGTPQATMSSTSTFVSGLTYINPAVTNATVNSVTATATAAAVAPVVSAGQTIVAAMATATALALAPVATGTATVQPPAATATATAPAPAVGITATVAAVPATATATAPAPVVTGVSNQTVQPPTATATATALPPVVGVVQNATVNAVTATATAGAIAPAVELSGLVTATAATATATALPPTVAIQQNPTVDSVPATATALVLPPMAFAEKQAPRRPRASIDPQDTDTDIQPNPAKAVIG